MGETQSLIHGKKNSQLQKEESNDQLQVYLAGLQKPGIEISSQKFQDTLNKAGIHEK